MPARFYYICAACLASGCVSSYKPTLSTALPAAATERQSAPPSGTITARRLLSKGMIGEACQAYLDVSRLNQKHDMATLHKIGKRQILEGLASDKPEVQLLSIFSIIVSQNEDMIAPLESALRSPFFQVQIAALRALASFQNDRAAQALFSAMRSNHLGVRLEASMHLADQKRIDASEQTEALMHKCPPEALPFFCHLFAKSGTQHALNILIQLMSHENPYVRSSAVLQAALFERRALESNLLASLSHTHPLELEAACFAAGTLRLESAVERLEQLRTHTHEGVCLSALIALDQLHPLDTSLNPLKDLVAWASQGNVFAIHALKDHPGSEPTLYALLACNDETIRMNAALSLLHLKDPYGLEFLAKLLAEPSLGVAWASSPARTMQVFCLKPLNSSTITTNPSLIHSTFAFKQHVISLCMQLPEEVFLTTVEKLIKTGNSECTSLAASALAMRGTDSCVHMLENLSQSPGAPWLRMRSALSLFTITREPKYLGEIKSWLLAHLDKDLIELIPYAPNPYYPTDTYDLRADEKSALLIEAWMTIAHSESETGLSLILDAFAGAPFRQRCALAGLLLKAIQ